MNDRYELFAPHVPYVRNNLRKLGLSYHDAEDVTQEALMRVCFNYDKNIGEPKPYLLKVAKNLAIDLMKKSECQKKHVAAYRPPESTGFPDPDIIKIVDVLPEAERRPVELMVFGGLSSREAGVELGISHDTAIKRRDRGLEKLRDLFPDSLPYAS